MEVNIKMHLKEVDCDVGNRTDLAKDRAWAYVSKGGNEISDSLNVN